MDKDMIWLNIAQLQFEHFISQIYLNMHSNNNKKKHTQCNVDCEMRNDIGMTPFERFN